MRLAWLLQSMQPQHEVRSVDAFKKCANDPLVVFAIARLFWAGWKIKKARHWQCSDRAVNSCSVCGF
jgi:hypothetical protein